LRAQPTIRSLIPSLSPVRSLRERLARRPAYDYKWLLLAAFGGGTKVAA